MTTGAALDEDWEGLTFGQFVEHMHEFYARAPADGPPWVRQGSDVGGDDYGRLVEALRSTCDAIAEARLGEAESAYLSGRLEEVSAYVRFLRAGVGERVWANRFDLAARGSSLPPRMDDLLIDPVHGRVRASVTFGTSYAGAGDAAHGGAVALLFDEILGLAANAGRVASRTASLHVDYRAVTPLNEPLVAVAGTARIEGRKRWVVGELRRGVQGDGTAHVVAEAEGLFVELRPWHA